MTCKCGSSAHVACSPFPERVYGEPPEWGDADWWRRTNTLKDVGEQYALARREANRLRRLAAGRRAFAERMGL